MNKYRSNIHKLYLIKIAKWFMLIMPIIVPFYESNGLGMQDIFVLQAAYSLSIVLLEIPSGYLADVLGRKLTLVLGSVLGFAGFAVYAFSYGFRGFLIAEIILGIGQSFISGADSAMLYDTLLEENKEAEFLKYEGRRSSAGNFAEGIAGILGGLLASVSLRTPYFFQTAIAFIAIPAALSLYEPYRHNQIIKLQSQGILHIVKLSLWKDKYLPAYMLYSTSIGTATLTMAWFVQPYFKQVELPLFLYGLFWTLLNLLVGLASLMAYKIEKHAGKIRTIILISFSIAGSYLLLSYISALWAISIIFFFYMVRGFAGPILKDYVNRHSGSEIRATVLSIRDFIIRLSFSIVGPILGWISDIHGLSTALFAAALFFFLFCSISLLFLLKTEFAKA